jgi:RNA polymerase sigma factor (sigma-70 family)
VSGAGAQAAKARTRRPPQRGDEAELFERYWDRLVRIVQGTIGAPRAVAEDACSFAWLQLLRTQPDRDATFAWLRVVATRESLRLLKAQGRYVAFDEDPFEATAVHVDESIDLQLAVEVREALEQIACLTAQQVRIFSLHIAGLSYDEICEATGYSWTQVNRHMLRARSRVRALRGSASSPEVPTDQTARQRRTGQSPAIGGAGR